MNKKNDVCAVVVTYNRLDMLKDAIDALKAQDYPCDILVINNGSTDGSKEYLDNEIGIEVIHQKNIGGAGGFYTGMKMACENGYGFVWVMDDDVIPAPDALKNIYNDYRYLSLSEKVGFICGRVKSINMEIANVPTIDYRPNSTGYPDWGKYLNKGCVRVETATFVSVFIPTSVIETVGLPYKEFFIWGDDTEFTKRITNSSFKAYCSGNSDVIHRRVGGALDITTFTEPNRIKMYKFSVRNNIFINKKYESTKTYMKCIFSYSTLFCKLIFKRDFQKAKVILSGIYSGFKFRPSISYPMKALGDEK